MPSVLAIGALSLEACRTKVADFLAGQDRPVRLIEVRLLDSKRSNGVGINEWRLEKDKNLAVIADQIALYIVRHQSAGATILVRRDDRS